MSLGSNDLINQTHGTYVFQQGQNIVEIRDTDGVSSSASSDPWTSSRVAGEWNALMPGWSRCKEILSIHLL